MECQVAEVVSADGVPIRYEVRGSEEPCLVLVHGWGGNRKRWQMHSETLPCSSRVAVVDLPGFGESGTGRSAWTMQSYGEDVAALVRALPTRKAVLVGHSLGAAAVLEAARLLPERVAGVVFVDIFHDPDAKDADPTGEQAVTGLRSVFGGPTVDLAKIRSLSFSPDTPEAVIRRAISDLPHPVPEHWWEIIRGFVRWKNSCLTEALAHLEVPLEAINSDPPQTKVDAYRRYVPGFRVATMPKVGHAGIIWERVEEFDRLLLDAATRFSKRASG
jgi:pimeloyl-ACP methyl ester carboxylesterase